MNIINGKIISGDLIVGNNQIYVNGKSASYTNGSGNIISKDFTDLLKTTNLNELIAGGVFHISIHVNKNNKSALIVEAEDNIIPLIEFKINSDSLEIDMTDSVSTNQKIKIILSVQSLNKIKLTGMSSIKGFIVNDKLHIKNSGNSKVQLEGNVHNLDIKLSGNGSMDLSKLYSKETYASISGMGDVHAIATNEFKGKISGMGNITIDGNPGVFISEKSGMGNITNTKKEIKDNSLDSEKEFFDMNSEVVKNAQKWKPDLSKENTIQNIKETQEHKKEGVFNTLKNKFKSML